MEYLVRKQEKTKQFVSLTIGGLAGWQLSGDADWWLSGLVGSQLSGEAGGFDMYVGIMEAFRFAVPIFLQFWWKK